MRFLSAIQLFRNVIAAVALCMGLCLFLRPAVAEDDAVYKELDKFVRVLRLVEQSYVHAVKDEDLIENALQGMLMGLDPHSMYLPKEIFEEFKTDTTGKFGGVGIEITVKDGALVVIAAIDGTPASRAGIEPGDIIVKIDGEETKTFNLYDAIKKMRGPLGEKIALTLYRPKTKKTVTVVLAREVVNIKSVVSERLGEGIALIQIRSFQDETEADFKRALETLEADPQTKLAGLVIDLRNNPGGLVEQAVGIADIFIEKGPIVSIKDRTGKTEVKKAVSPKTMKIPLIVLVNEGSASASEILAGALEDYGRALLVGTKTFGKGSVQTVIELPDGSGIKLTVAYYYTPKGRFIDGKGLMPNIVVDEAKWRKDTTEKNKKPDSLLDYQKQEAVRRLKQWIKHH